MKKISKIEKIENNPYKIYKSDERRYFKMNRKTLLFLTFLSTILLVAGVFAAPSGVSSITGGASTTAQPANPDSIDAYAGNITEVTITGTSTTQAWQGYAGNVTGTIQLADSGSHVLYNWSQVNPRGQIYASVNDSINWSDMQCFNFTATGAFGDDSGNVGATSKVGMNATQLNTAYGILIDDSDRVENTFTANTHAEFYTNSLNFSLGECKNVKLFDSTGTGSFDEALLYDPTTTSVVFTSLLKSDGDGFDANTHDFEMLVLENGHSGNTDTTLYYFYMEIA